MVTLQVFCVYTSKRHSYVFYKYVPNLNFFHRILAFLISWRILDLNHNYFRQRAFEDLNHSSAKGFFLASQITQAANLYVNFFQHLVIASMCFPYSTSSVFLESF